MRKNLSPVPLGKTAVVAAFGVALSLAPARARAHCDSLDGPVVADGKAALATGDATVVLKWVGPKQEPEVRDAFQRTIAVRKLGTDVRILADTYFFETLVRLHRETEGMPYIGLKPAGNQPVFIAKVDSALASGSVDDFAKLVAGQAVWGIRSRFQKTSEARKKMTRSVADGRAYVAAYVDLMHYVEEVVSAVQPEGHSHGNASPAAPARVP